MLYCTVVWPREQPCFWCSKAKAVILVGSQEIRSACPADQQVCCVSRPHGWGRRLVNISKDPGLMQAAA
jgi:hypothetical protein